MTAETCAGIVRESKKYGSVCDETILRIASEEICKYRSDKDVIKSVKTKLHQITGAFIGEDDIKRADALLTGMNKDRGDIKDTVNKILSLHASSSERAGFVDELYRDIFSTSGSGGTVLDIACGFNPFYVMSRNYAAEIKYHATDINVKIIDLLNKFFRLAGVGGVAYASDILYRIPSDRFQNVFLFKIIPLLEQQRKGYVRQLINRLDSEFFTITFPTKSLSGRNCGMCAFYSDFMRNSFPADKFEYCLAKEYSNELLFIIRKKEQLG
jgi:16S rRNA (guanine(1405)-N(7))-methyltransferase